MSVPASKAKGHREAGGGRRCYWWEPEHGAHTYVDAKRHGKALRPADATVDENAFEDQDEEEAQNDDCDMSGNGEQNVASPKDQFDGTSVEEDRIQGEVVTVNLAGQ
jgi:hypothetical protein